MTNQQNSPSKYLAYLPAFYSRPQPDDPSLFIGRYLKIFEKLLSGIDDWQTGDSFVKARKGIRELLATETIGDFFHPRLSYLFHLFADDAAALDQFIPPFPIEDKTLKGEVKNELEQRLQTLGAYVGQTDDQIAQWLRDFLDWLASTVGLAVDKKWTVDQRRFVIAQILPLYRARGTVRGIEWLLNVWFGLDKDAPVVGPPPSGIRLLEITVENPPFPLIGVRDNETDNEAYRIQDTYFPGMPAVCDTACWDPFCGIDSYQGYVGSFFRVTLRLGTGSETPAKALLLLGTEDGGQSLSAIESKLENLLEEFKPALTRYEVRTIPSFRLGAGGLSTAAPLLSQLQGDVMSDHVFSSKPTRLKYQPGMSLTADHMQLEQQYLLDKLQALSQLLMTPGVLGGAASLAVQRDETDRTWIYVQAGRAIDQEGRLLQYAGRDPVKVKVGPRSTDSSEDSCYMYAAY
ncbi:MAG: hypothetical protein QOI13_2869, partial [Paraburkholderia sp.]|nr:hypothetical protein [Paraburkholderia sp.]